MYGIVFLIFLAKATIVLPVSYLKLGGWLLSYCGEARTVAAT